MWRIFFALKSSYRYYADRLSKVAGSVHLNMCRIYCVQNL
ncbi:hypothetical protein ENTCAN_07840 [Enterobacter cancerogenus ATCC 35316]|nr:hypothetical protein ENTCAN_07840 [Enterobacter cancerogenus ATCC 35316]